jgi:ELWxxDGT repeat protein/VCBS repeat-containing protein
VTDQVTQECLDASEFVYSQNAVISPGTSRLAESNLQLIADSRSTISNGLSDGFFAQAFRDLAGNIIIAFEGSILDPSSGFYNTTFGVASRAADEQLLEGNRPAALVHAVTFVRQVEAEANNAGLPVYVTGHSLGGAEAEEVARQAAQGGPAIAGGYTFGAPGLPQYTGGPNSQSTLTDYIDYGDPVGNFASDAQSALNTLAPATLNHYGRLAFVGNSSDRNNFALSDIGNGAPLDLVHLFLTHDLDAWGSLLNDAIHERTLSTLLDAGVLGIKASFFHTMDNYINDLASAYQITFNGDSGANRIVGNVANNLINGYRGDDVLAGAAGNDTIDGGDGTDTAVFQLNAGHYTTKLYGGKVIVSGKTSVDQAVDGTDTLYNVEYLQFADMKIAVFNNPDVPDLTAGTAPGGKPGDGGLSTVVASMSSGTEKSIVAPLGQMINGTDASEYLTGTSGPDVIHGNGGDDVLTGYSAQDVLDGGPGSDTADYSYEPADVSGTIDLAAGTATFPGYYTEQLISIENVWMGAGNDTIYGTSGDNDLRGGPGDDTFYPGAGNDVVYGDWRYSDQSANDTVVLPYTFGSGYTVSGTANALNIVGANGNDRLYNIEHFQFAGGVTKTAREVLQTSPVTSGTQTIFFVNSDSTTGSELWVTDGTASGTRLITDIYHGPTSSSPSDLTAVNGKLFFSADDGVHGRELWSSDGTGSGTVLVKDIRLGNAISDLYELTSYGGKLLFFAADGNAGFRLWASDGTAAGTAVVSDVNAYKLNKKMIAVNDLLFFAGYDSVHGEELWESNGTRGGTRMVKEINTRTDYLNSDIDNLTDVNGTLFFSAYGDSEGRNLWKSDGTVAGTVPIIAVPAVRGTAPFSFINANGILFFEVRGDSQELWRSDGTPNGTFLLAPVDDVVQVGGQFLPYEADLTDVHGTVFFSAEDRQHGSQLWASDGTAAGTRIVAYINSAGNSAPQHLTDLNGSLYFGAFDGTGWGLWKSDATAQGTVLIKGMTYAGSNSDGFSDIRNVNGTLYFEVQTGTQGQYDFWKSDGTAAGTVQLFSGLRGDYHGRSGIVGVGTAPIAQRDLLSTGSHSPLPGNLLLENGQGADNDPNGGTLTVAAVNEQASDVGQSFMLPSGALLTVNPDGRFAYDPNGKFDGLSVGQTASDSFTYTIADGQGDTATATAAITITGPPPPDQLAPTITHQNTLVVPTGGTGNLTSNLLQFDDNVSPHAQEIYTIITTPAHGSLLRSSSATFSFTQADIDNGLITYHEDGSVASSDSFTFSVTDAAGNQTAAQHFQFSITPPPYPDIGDFDPNYYLATYRDVAAAAPTGADPAGFAFQHYNQYGWHEGRNPDALFNTNAYELTNPDVAAAGVNPLQHYEQYGWKEGRDPSAGFSSSLYLLHNPDVKAAGVDPLQHYLQYGMKEGRADPAAIGHGGEIGDFDPHFYLLANPDVAAAAPKGTDPASFALQHYETYGWKEGRDPNALFSTTGYLNAYADVKAAGVNPLDHYEQYGWHEGRDPSTQFDTHQYLAHYTDVAAAQMDPLQHYLDYGAWENRVTFGDAKFG